jgi:hypothetical protein
MQLMCLSTRNTFQRRNALFLALLIAVKEKINILKENFAILPKDWCERL